MKNNITTANMVLAKCGVKCKIEKFEIFSRQYFSIPHFCLI